MFRFIGMPDDVDTVLAASLATVVWLGSLVLLMTAYRLARDLYITILGYSHRIQQRWMRVGRNAARRTSIAARGVARKRSERPIEPTISEEVELGELEYAVLRCHGELGRGPGLTAADIAEALDLRISQIRKAVEVLLMLQLIDVVSGAAGHANGTYRLTPHGQGFLAACTAVAAAPVAA
jgi:DNA-binding MarR family transcriptional regulator